MQQLQTAWFILYGVFSYVIPVYIIVPCYKEMENIISNLNFRKSYQEEEIKFSKLNKDLIEIFTVENFNGGIDTGHFLSELKHVDTLLVHKKMYNADSTLASTLPT